MTRIARIVVPGAAHHVTQRGNNRQDVFFVEDDKRVYLRLLGEQSQRFGLRIEGYCLMTNHVHLVAVPATEDALTLAVGRTHFLYTQYINRLHGRSGHLWQNRFFSCPMDEDHAVNALCYIELNPVRAGMVRVPWRYPWSSAAAHCGKTASDALLALTEWREAMPPETWIATLKVLATDDSIPTTLRRNTHTGRPLGGDAFLSMLETLLGRRVRPLPVGRPHGIRNAKPDKQKKGMRHENGKDGKK